MSKKIIITDSEVKNHICDLLDMHLDFINGITEQDINHDLIAKLDEIAGRAIVVYNENYQGKIEHYEFIELK